MEKEKTEDQPKPESEGNIKEDSPNDASEAELKKVEEKNPEEKIIDLEEKIVRLYAEMENQRRRYEKEKEDAFEYGGFAFARETLNLLDNLDRSRISIENDGKLKNSDSIKKILEHLDIIKKDMISIFKKNNIKHIETLNKKLDPNFHQAMMEVEDDAKEPGTIVQEIQSGYMMKDRLLRPALVAVSKKLNKSEKKDEIPENEEKNNEK